MSSNENAVTFDEAVEDVSEQEDGYNHRGDIFEDLDLSSNFTFEDLRDEFDDVETFLQALPDNINSRDEVDEPGITPPGQREEVIGRLELPDGLDLQEAIFNIGEGLSDVDDILENISGDLGNLNQRQLLQVIAQAQRGNLQANRTLATIQLQQSQTMVDQLQSLFDILTSVEPLFSITVSGTNTIDQAGVPQPAVPDSNNISIPTRRLIIKSSDSNNDDIAFGDDEVNPASGFLLSPGENISLPMDLRETALWMASNTVGEKIEILGVA